MFYDQARIYVKSGDGGDGMISFRREKFVPLGGPDGADGGPGGDIIFVVNPNMNSLARYHKQVHFRAENGGHGGTRNKTGATGADLVLEVPPGTTIRDAESGELLGDLVSEDDRVTILAGGRPGRGNARFASSTNQAPRIAERGEPGRERWLTLELKLIADVGIVGVPNAGKSTLLSAVSAARPRIDSYPFTTLQPNLGVVEVGDGETMVWADIPGLIEGASAGVGLGHDFLRHVERTRVLIHLLDGAASDPLEDWAMINQELALYDVRMEEKPQIVVFNKMDLPDAQAWEPLIAERIEAEGLPFHAISAATGEGVRDLVFKVYRLLQEAPPVRLYQDEDELPVIRPEEDEEMWRIFRVEDGVWRVRGKKIERIAAQTYFEFDATAERFQRILDKMGISAALREAGVEEGDTVIIGDETLEWTEV
ncbi:MAG: GTPase ObgE [Chloroflexi bacterium]|nr:GTPase ObgE [Chloroflexota bacterium]